RGIEKFAPWVNKVHFITWGHVPDWLVEDHPKLNVVSHHEFMPPEFLPTFNSRSIEFNMHNIKGLSEKFIYFNDDMFLTDKTVPEDFFEDGKPKDMFALYPVFAHSEEPVSKVMFNDMGVINK